MFHERVVSGFDIEVLLGEPFFFAVVRAGLAAALGSDGAIDLAAHGTVAPEDRCLHIRLSDVDIHGGEPHGDLTIKLRLGLGPSPIEAKLGRRAASVAPAPTPTRVSPQVDPAKLARPTPTPVRGRPMPIPQGPPLPEASPTQAALPPLPETHVALKLRMTGDRQKIRVEPGVMARELATLGGWLTGQLSGPIALGVLAVLDTTLRSLRFDLPGLDRAPRIAWAWVAGDAQTQPCLALLANLDLDFRAKASDPKPSPTARGDVAARRNHLPPGVAIRVAMASTAVGRLQRAGFWALPNQIGQASLQRCELLLRATQPGYVDVRIEFEVELPGLNGSLAYQVPVTPRVVNGAFDWHVGTVARATDSNLDFWAGFYDTVAGMGNLFGAGMSYSGEFLRSGSDAFGNNLTLALAPLAGILPTRVEVARLGNHAVSLGFAATSVAVDGKGLSFHLAVRS
ncbi:MAG: hypothetical protein H0T76_01120 [Nannocystis sp.]|nr:hypothetical protein [Nannocystis sp.]MBA3545062.1 hypothetical protein [Nannocystis sp.]